ncbi:uncharacterized protein LOC115626471 [Scaptodrosophila lebanonensis]|uniref:Uncharacterized protein LOC115626471 n=1 Tax=Drosophila lebanonensis TaxID=7225 RepID=A0A6J2TQC5_DROLE|nr:uncharacterized protein LOC115626471 [Scaptodrosophila lebanonensis]
MKLLVLILTAILLLCYVNAQDGNRLLSPIDRFTGKGPIGLVVSDRKPPASDPIDRFTGKGPIGLAAADREPPASDPKRLRLFLQQKIARAEGVLFTLSRDVRRIRTKLGEVLDDQTRLHKGLEVSRSAVKEAKSKNLRVLLRYNRALAQLEDCKRTRPGRIVGMIEKLREFEKVNDARVKLMYLSRYLNMMRDIREHVNREKRFAAGLTDLKIGGLFI